MFQHISRAASRSSLSRVFPRSSLLQLRPLSVVTWKDGASNLSSSTQPLLSSWNAGSVQQQQPQQLSARFFSSTAAQPDATPSEDTSFRVMRRKKMRNVAIIAHVDHGKTTMVDKLLMSARQSHLEDGNAENLSRLMDSGDLEKERGITITSKVTRVDFLRDNGESMILNIVDTPGHSDFSGEVDRILSMVDGVCLLVDAAEGPMTQTKYVLSRALSAGLKPVVVLNKCDRPDAVASLDSGETESKLLDLFDALGASEDQMSYATAYASARAGWVVMEDPFKALELSAEGYKSTGAKDDENSMKTLLEAIIEHIPEPAVRCYDIETPSDEKELMDATAFENDRFSMTVVSVGSDNFLGRTCTGRIVSGSVAIGDKVQLLRRRQIEGEASGPTADVNGMFCYEGVSRTELGDARAFAGDCVTLAGVPEGVAVGDTLTSASNPIPAPIETPPLIPPTLAMEFGANNGPFAGQEGTQLTSSKIRERLMAETDNNVTLKVENSLTDAEKTTVYARGELQLGILIETMRREGFEMVLTPPRVLTVMDPETNTELEPFEEVIVDVDAEYQGAVVGSLTGKRKGTVIEMSESKDGKCRLVFEVPSRGLLGFNSEIAALTRGAAVVNHLFVENRPHLGTLESSYGKPKLVCTAMGKATAFALESIAARGTLFISTGDEVYSGMVIGENSKQGIDLEVNAVKAKELTNMRTHSKDDTVRLSPPKQRTLEELIGYMSEDEVIEVTPKSIRLRKAILDKDERGRVARVRTKQLRAAKEKLK